MALRARQGFTLVELLTIITIIALIGQMLLPAVQMAREAARRMQCANHLRQLGVAATMHEGAHRFYPSGGWGRFWSPDPDRGFGHNQPGGWAYSVLPFLEQDVLHRIGGGSSPEEREDTMKPLYTTPLALMMCPSRRSAKLYPYTFHTPSRTYPGVHPMVKGDYAMNAGDDGETGTGGPGSVEEAMKIPYDESWRTRLSGVSFLVSEIRVNDIADGLSNTILVGEKYVRPEHYTDGLDLGDNECLYTGADSDTLRTTHVTMPPAPDQRGVPWDDSFGSAHPGACNFYFCDGSARRISYGIDPQVYSYLGNRHDGQTIDPRRLDP